MASGDTSNTMTESPNDTSFPNAQLAPPAPSSVISSRMTDIASDDGEQYQQTSSARTATNPNRQSAQTFGDRRSRPGTSVSSRSPWTQSPPSRRGFTGPLSQRLSMQGSPSATGRSQSAASRTSRTHVPSLTQHAFFRPMSSQRLQAQRRGSRPPTTNQQGFGDGAGDGISTYGENNSQAQDQYSNQAPKPSGQDDGEVPPPPSRGTEITEQETSGRLTSNTSPTHGRPGASSMSESVRPLNKVSSNTKGLSLNIDKSYKSPSGLPTPSRSPISFRSNLRMPAKESGGPNSPSRSTHGREKLASSASSPALTPVGTSQQPNAVAKTRNQNLGKNYQYFSGNTRFWWGGRLQNARDRPVNIATGLFVILPGVLFFVFSAPWLWHNISPAIPIVFAYIFCICISSFFHASVTDPGVSPCLPTLKVVLTNTDSSS